MNSLADAAGSFPRTLLLTGTLPQTNGVGGIILSDLCQFLPADSLCVAHVHGGATSEVPALGVPARGFPASYQQRPTSRFGRAGRAVQWLLQTARNRRGLKRQIAACVEWARQQRVEQVWAVLDAPVSIEMAGPVAAALGVPLLVTVWDDIDHNTRYFGLDRVTSKRLTDRFARTLRSCSGCAVIGETMKAEYERKYGVRAVIVRHGLPPELLGRDRAGQGERKGVVIGFAGSVSAASAFQSLLATLDQLQWSIDGRPVTLRLLGHRFDLKSPVARRIECYGWRSVPETLELLSDCDFNYLPQPFEPEWLPFASLSFPTKLTTYLAAGAPLLLHAPANASLPAFMAKYPFGAWCSTLDRDSLAASMRQLLDRNFAAASVRAGQDALGIEFTRSNFRSQFAAFLGVDEARLNG